MALADRYERIVRHIAQVAREAGRDPESVRLIAVSKTVGEEGVAEAIAAGARDFGENRPDSIVAKAQAHPQVTWHFIGNIQSRRIRDIVQSADVVHSLYQAHHIDRFETECAQAGKVLDVLVEVNVSGEASKSGCAPDEAADLVRAVAAAPHLRARGLMTMAPQGDKETARSCFEGLRALADRIRGELAPDDAAVFNELSMGMSEDWPEAVAAGATMVRVGRAIFDDAFEAEGLGA